jgi:cell wall-associated NlpC family hydrolase
MTHIRRLLSLLAVMAAVAFALVKPLPGRAAAAARKAPPTRSPQSRDTFGVRIVAYAKRFRGIRYEYGGTSPRSGFDCSGFVRFVYAHFGITLPHSSYADFDQGRRVSRSSLRPGDLVFFDSVGHVGIYVGNGRFIHAPHSGTRVRIEQLGGWYSSRFVGARRIKNA